MKRVFVNKLHRNKNLISVAFAMAILLCANNIQSFSGAETSKLGNDFIADRIQTLYSDENSILANEANTVIQTEDGYIWIGSYSGLMKFDGKEITKITSLEYPEFTAQSIRSLYESKDKTLYIATNDEGLYVYKKGTFTRITDEKNELSNSIRSVFEDSKGTIFAATTNGLGKVWENKLVPVVAEGFSSEFLVSGAIDVENNIWLVSDGGNVIILKDNKIFDTYSVMYLENLSATHVFVNAKQQILVGTNRDSVIVFETNNGERISKTYPLKGILNVTTVYEDHQHKMWIGGEGGFGYLSDAFEFIRVEGSYLNGFVEKIFQDYEGNYWIVSSKQGVLKLTNSKFTNVTLANGLSTFSVNSTKLWEDQLYIGTDKGLILIGKNGIIENDFTKFFNKTRIRALNEDSKGNLWVSTYGENGVVRYGKDHSIKGWNEANGLTKNKVRMVLEGKDEKIYVATTEGITVIENDTIKDTYTTEDGLANPYILCLCEDSEGNLYAGSDGGGIFKIKEGKIENYSERNGLSSGVILRMAYDANRDALFISAGGKLNILKDGRVTEYSGFKMDANIFDIKVAEDKLVLLAANGLYILKTDGVLDGTYTSFDLYDKYDGLNSFPVANSWNELTENGELYISGGKGVYQINIFNIFKNNIVPKFAVNFVEVDGVRYRNIQALKIPASARRISFDASVMSFSDPKNNGIQYQLEGFDKERIIKKLEDLSVLTYTNLDGGKYSFKLKGSNADGITSNEMVKIDIHKKLGLLENPLTYMFIMLVLILLTMEILKYFYKARELKILKKQQEYKRITRQAIETISRTIDAKDHYTSGHSQRVADYSVIIGKALGMKEEMLESLYYIALLHDIGKIGTPDEVLNKKDRLTIEEFELIKDHVIKGNEILKDFVEIEGFSEGALYHHEKYDGSGYIFGLNGKEIPLNARIISVADAYDAMSSKRSYRNELPREVILSEFQKFKGIQFDPEIASIMCALIESNKIEALSVKDREAVNDIVETEESN